MCNEFWRCANSLKLKLKFLISTQEYLEGYLKKPTVSKSNLTFIINAGLRHLSVLFKLVFFPLYWHCTICFLQKKRHIKPLS